MSNQSILLIIIVSYIVLQIRYLRADKDSFLNFFTVFVLGVTSLTLLFVLPLKILTVENEEPNFAEFKGKLYFIEQGVENRFVYKEIKSKNITVVKTMKESFFGLNIVEKEVIENDK